MPKRGRRERRLRRISRVRSKKRKLEERRARGSMSPTARKLVRRIARIRTRSELGYVGRSLYRAMQGEIPLPGTVSPPEWAVVFREYRSRKTAMLSANG